MENLRGQGFRRGELAVICEMGKPHKDDVPATSGGMTPNRSVGRKRELGWQVIYIVTVMGFVGMLQLIVVENTWWSSRYRQTPHVSTDFGKTKTMTTMFQRSSPTSSNSFLPMKDETQQGMSNTDTNWFMSRLHGRMSGSGETFDLPGDDPDGRLLCVRGADQDDGTKNSYGLFRTLPADAVLLPGTTFIADNYWDYHNPWHAMSALANFATWRMENKCAAPERLLLYHMGELVVSMGEWITHVLHAAFMKPIPLETLTLTLKHSSAVCFERAVVQRRGLGGVDEAHMHGVFDMMRCKARRYCNVSQRQNPQRAIAVLLLTRSGPRAFANESGVAAVVRSECEKVPGCSLRVLNAANLTFCQQVRDCVRERGSECLKACDIIVSPSGRLE